MKKTLIALTALAMASVAFAATETTSTTYAFTNGIATLGTGLTHEMTWTLTGTVGFGSEKAGDWGTALVATGDDPVAVEFWNGFQVFLNTSGKVLSKFNGASEQDAFTGLNHSSVLTYTLSWDAATKKMALDLSAGARTQHRETVIDNANFTLACLSTNTNSAMASAGTYAWEMSDVTVSVTTEIPDVTPDTPAVPEPTTATLSLLALAGLAARRRRK